MLRAYFFCNYYLSTVQHGVQSVHVTSEMFLKYRDVDKKESKVLYDWADVGKTVVFLNGGNSGALETLRTLFDSPKNPFPWASFNEDAVSLNSALTCVGIVLPEVLARANEETKNQLRDYATYVAQCKSMHKKVDKKLMSESLMEIEKYCGNLEYAYQLMTLVQACQLVR